MHGNLPLLRRSQGAPPTRSMNVEQLKARLGTWGAHPTERTLACHAEFLSAVVEGRGGACEAFPKDCDVDGLMAIAEQLEAFNPAAALKIIAHVLLAGPAAGPGLEQRLVEKGIALLANGKVDIERTLGERLHDHVAVDGHFEVMGAGLVKQFLHALEEKLPGVCKPVERIELRSETLMKVVDNLGLCLEPGDDDAGMSPAEAAERLTKAFRAGVELDHREATENCLFWLNSCPPEAGDAYLADCRTFQRDASGLAAVDHAREAMESGGWELSAPPGGFQWQLTLRAPAAGLETVVDYAAVCMKWPHLLPPGQMKAVCGFLQDCGLDVVDQWQLFMRSPWDSQGLPALLDQIDGDLQRAADSGRCWSARQLTPLRRFVCAQAAQAGCSPQLEARLFGMWRRLVRLPGKDFVVEAAQEASAWSGRRLECRNLLKRLCTVADVFSQGLLIDLMEGVSFSAAAMVAQYLLDGDAAVEMSPLRTTVLAELLKREWSTDPRADLAPALNLLVGCLPSKPASVNSFACILGPVLSRNSPKELVRLLRCLRPGAEQVSFVVPPDVGRAISTRDAPAIARVDVPSIGQRKNFALIRAGRARQFDLAAAALVSLMAQGLATWSRREVQPLCALANEVGGWHTDRQYASLCRAVVLVEILERCPRGALSTRSYLAAVAKQAIRAHETAHNADRADNQSGDLDGSPERMLARLDNGMWIRQLHRRRIVATQSD